jgi:hypothetical protein
VSECCDQAIAQERATIIKWLGIMQLAAHKEPMDYASMIALGDHHKSIDEILMEHLPKIDPNKWELCPHDNLKSDCEDPMCNSSGLIL